MRYCVKDNTCYALLGCKAPKGTIMLDAPFKPLGALVSRDPVESEASFAAMRPSDLEDRGTERLRLHDEKPGDAAFFDRMSSGGMRCVNTAYPGAFESARPFITGKAGMTLQIAGLGDVGCALLCGLVLLGAPFERIGIFDPDEKRCRRAEMEANQILSLSGRTPRVEILSKDALFDCDAFAFTASAGVPPVGSSGDVRLKQLEKNRTILSGYAQAVRDKHYRGLFFQVSDPVDLLAKEMFLLSNTGIGGMLDYAGLRPEQIIGLGLGVMLARADYAAYERGITDFLRTGRGFGPHGSGLVIANALGAYYNDALSLELTQAAVTANVAVRETGFKPYIAPALSSACVQIIRAVSGESFDAAIALDGVYMGCRARLTPCGLLPERAELPAPLYTRVKKAYDDLQAYGR